MLRTTFFAIAALFLFEAAQRAPDAAAQGAPRFTLADEIIIARNDALTELFPVDPEGVRKILDALAAAKQRSPSGETAPRRERQRDAGAVVIDPTRNPDLDLLQRAAPEAAYDLFQILKRVAGGSGVK